MSVGRVVVSAMVGAALFPAATALAQLTRPPVGTQPLSPPPAESRTDVRVLPDRAFVSPGETFHIAIVFEVQRDWHLYWKNPGAGAMAPDVRLALPEGFRAGAIHWPRPALLKSSVGDMYGYEGRFMLLAPITAPEQVEPGHAPITLDVAWAVCDKDKCLFGRKDVATSIEVRTEGRTERGEPKLHPLVQDLMATLPIPADESPAASAHIERNRLVIEAPALDFSTATFFPHLSRGVTYGEAEIEVRGERLHVSVPLEINAANFEGGRPDVGGVLALGDAPGDPSYEFTVPLPDDAAP